MNNDTGPTDKPRIVDNRRIDPKTGMVRQPDEPSQLHGAREPEPDKYMSPCRTCGGRGIVREEQRSTTVSPNQTLSVPDGPCQRCDGTGSVHGRETSRAEFEAYFNEPCVVLDEIERLAKQLQQPRTVRSERHTTVRKQRPVEVKRKCKVGGFLGLGGRTEYYDDVEIEHYDEPVTEFVDEVAERGDIELASFETWWTDGEIGVDYQDEITSVHKIVLTVDGEFEIRLNRHEERNFAQKPWHIDVGWTEQPLVPIASFDDILVNFDFHGRGSWYDRTIHFNGHSSYLGPGGYKVEELSYTRLYKKGYGLLARLNELLEQDHEAVQK